MYGSNVTGKYGHDYDAQHFLDVWEELGEQMDRFASDPRIEELYDASVDVKKPPAQLLARPLRKTSLGQRLLTSARARQGFGHFTRHVMQKRGYQLDRGEVRIPNPTVFSFGARYRA
jgi:hypothetical protein